MAISRDPGLDNKLFSCLQELLPVLSNKLPYFSWTDFILLTCQCDNNVIRVVSFNRLREKLTTCARSILGDLQAKLYFQFVGKGKIRKIWNASLHNRLSWTFYIKIFSCLLRILRRQNCTNNKLPFSELRPCFKVHVPFFSFFFGRGGGRRGQGRRTSHVSPSLPALSIFKAKF